jgi:hypothetical protein
MSSDAVNLTNLKRANVLRSLRAIAIGNRAFRDALFFVFTGARSQAERGDQQPPRQQTPDPNHAGAGVVRRKQSMNEVLNLAVSGTGDGDCTDPPIGALLLDYARDLLADEKKVRAFDKHVAHCDFCQGELAEWTRIFEIFGGCYEKKTKQPAEGVRANAAGNTAK